MLYNDRILFCSVVGVVVDAAVVVVEAVVVVVVVVVAVVVDLPHTYLISFLFSQILPS